MKTIFILLLIYIICIPLSYLLNKYAYKKTGEEPVSLSWVIPIVNLIAIILLLFILFQYGLKNGYLSEKYWTDRWDKKIK